MNPRHTSKDRTPAGRAVPALLVAGLLLLAGWLLVSLGQLEVPLHRAGSAEEPTWIAIPRIGVKASVVPVGLQADGAMQVPDPGQVGWYRLGPRPGAPGPAVLVGHLDSRTGPAVSTGCGSCAPATRSSSASAPEPPAASWSGGWSATARRPCPSTGSGPARPGRCCAWSPAAAASTAPPATTATT